MQPEPGRAVAYVDWSQQEFGIAAALSGDTAMMEAYTSGDPYLTFAKQARAVPADATKKSHPREREQFKVCALAVQYGMGPQSLAQSLGQPDGDGPGAIAVAPGDLPDVLALVGFRRESRHAARLAANRVRLAGPGGAAGQSPIPGKLPHASQRRGNAAAGLLLGDGAGRCGLRPRA